MPAAVEEIIVEQSDTFHWTAIVKDSTGTPYDLSAVGASFVARSEYGSQHTIVTWSTGGGQITCTASGEVIIKVDDSVTKLIEDSGVYMLRLNDFDPSVGFLAGDVFRLLQGAFTLKKGI